MSMRFCWFQSRFSSIIRRRRKFDGNHVSISCSIPVAGLLLMLFGFGSKSYNELRLNLLCDSKAIWMEQSWGRATWRPRCFELLPLSCFGRLFVLNNETDSNKVPSSFKLFKVFVSIKDEALCLGHVIELFFNHNMFDNFPGAFETRQASNRLNWKIELIDSKFLAILEAFKRL